MVIIKVREDDNLVVVSLARVEVPPQLRGEVDAQIVFAFRIPHRGVVDKDLIATIEINSAAIRVPSGNKLSL